MSKINLIALLLCIYLLHCQENKLEGTQLASQAGSVGLELSSPAKITKIGFTHTSSNSKDYLLGVFQGANDQTFLDAFPLYMIKEQIQANTMQSVQISCTQKFKYVRYVSPDPKSPAISQLEVYGDAQAAESTENSNYYQPTNLPLLIINSENSELPQGRDRETRVNTNTIIVDKGKVNVNKKASIKLRGNSSLDSEKKPYLIKFEEKTTFLDMPCNDKKWVLVPNMYDKSLLRNILGYKMSFIFGLKFSPSCRFVDFILNGNYRGNYLICDKIEVQEDRIAVTKMDQSSSQEPEITGGYLVQGTGSKTKGSPDLFSTSKGIAMSFEYPDIDDITEQQKTYIKNKINEVEAKIDQGNVENIDLESFARYFLVEDFSGNQDGIYNSFFIYKERGDEKFYFGPVWDFDLAFDNAMILYPTNEKKNFAYKFSLSNGPTNKVVSQILSNEAVLKKIKDTWTEMTNTVFTKKIILDFLNEQIEYINESQKLNFMKWNVLNSRQFMEAAMRGSFQAEVDYLKEFVENRFDVFGGIVNSATKDSVLEETQGGWGMPFGGGDWGGNPFGGNGNNPWGGNGNNPWGGNGDNPWGGNGNNPWGGNGDNGGNNPWGGNGNNPWGGNGDNGGNNPWGGNGNNPWGGN